MAIRGLPEKGALSWEAKDTHISQLLVTSILLWNSGESNRQQCHCHSYQKGENKPKSNALFFVLLHHSNIEQDLKVTTYNFFLRQKNEFCLGSQLVPFLPPTLLVLELKQYPEIPTCFLQDSGSYTEFPESINPKIRHASVKILAGFSPQGSPWKTSEVNKTCFLLQIQPCKLKQHDPDFV